MRSKTLLAANILATVYSVLLAWFFVGLIILDNGGNSIITALGGFFESVFEIVNMELAVVRYLFVLRILSYVHVGFLIMGSIISWIAYMQKNSTIAMVASVLFVIGTISAPIYCLFGIPISVLAFIGFNNQKKLNKEKN